LGQNSLGDAGAIAGGEVLIAAIDREDVERSGSTGERHGAGGCPGAVGIFRNHDGGAEVWSTRTVGEGDAPDRGDAQGRG